MYCNKYVFYLNFFTKIKIESGLTFIMSVVIILLVIIILLSIVFCIFCCVCTNCCTKIKDAANYIKHRREPKLVATSNIINMNDKSDNRVTISDGDDDSL